MVVESVLNLYAFNLGYCERLSAELESGTIYKRPVAALHSPGWILGHLAIATDWAGRFVGLERECPADWHRAFGPGKTDEVEDQTRPTKEELLAALRRGHERVAAAVARGLDEERMAQPHGVGPLTGTPIRTANDVLVHLLTTHEATHLGQLSVCRRAAGLPALF